MESQPQREFAVPEPCFLFVVQVEFTREVEEDDKSKSLKHNKRILFQRMAAYPQRKVITFNRYTDDFEFYVNYGDLSFLSQDDMRWVEQREPRGSAACLAGEILLGRPCLPGCWRTARAVLRAVCAVAHPALPVPRLVQFSLQTGLGEAVLQHH